MSIANAKLTLARAAITLAKIIWALAIAAFFYKHPKQMDIHVIWHINHQAALLVSHDLACLSLTKLKNLFLRQKEGSCTIQVIWFVQELGDKKERDKKTQVREREEEVKPKFS